MVASSFHQIFLTWLLLLMQNGLKADSSNKAEMREQPSLFNFYQFYVPDPFACPGDHRPRISPDGTYFAMRKLDKTFMFQLIIYKTKDVLSEEKPSGKQVTFGKPGVGIVDFIWSMDNKTIIYRERQMNSSCQLVGVDAESGVKRVVMPGRCPMQFFAQSRFRPHHIVIGMPNPTPKVYTSDLYILDTRNGQLSLVLSNTAYVLMFFDHNLNMKAAIKMPKSADLKPEDMSIWKNVSNKMEVLYQLKELIDGYYTKPYCPCFEAGKACDFPFSAFDLSGKTVYMLSTVNWEMMSLTAVDFETNAETVFFAAKKANVDWVLMDPRTEMPVALSTRFGKQEITVLDKSLNGDIEFLKSVYPGQDFYIRQRSLDFNYWIVEYEITTHPIKYYLYERSTKKIKFIYSPIGNLMPGLDTSKTADVYPYEMKSSDGFDQACFLTIPYEYDVNKDGKPSKPMPVIIYVHPGPWLDRGGMCRYGMKEQFYANRGYGIINCNYPSSRGYGKTFGDARDKLDWLKIGPDVKLMAEKAIRDKVADPNRIGVTGESNGGSWTMYSVVFHPELFKCGDSWYGHSEWARKDWHRDDPSENIPAWMMKRWTVDFENPESVRQMRAKSPPYNVYRMSTRQSMLLSTGAAGLETPQQTRFLYEMIKQRGDINATFLFLPGEPHGYHHPENVNAVYHVSELFFQRCLGGRAQPLGSAIKDAIDFHVVDTGGLPQLNKTG